MDFSRNDPICLLVDNGSLQPAPTLALRRIAATLARRIGRPVAPVSLLHSNKVAAEALEGAPAETFDEALQSRHARGARQFLVVPLFFGPSWALTGYIPERVAALAATLPGLRVTVAAPVAGAKAEPDARLAQILASGVRGVVAARNLPAPVVVLVDHGSPQRAVTAVRDRVAAQLAAELGDAARAVLPASMERRDGSDYDFNEPLLERALATAPCGDGAGDVVIGPMFFSAGRHAGPGGDIETIARAVEARVSGMRVHFAPLVGEHPLLIDLLADRHADAVTPQG